MRLPLFLSARPQYAQRSGIVKINTGKWIVVGEGVGDSVIIIRASGDPLSLLNVEPVPIPFEVEGPKYLVAEFQQRGSEQFINVFAVRQPKNINANA